MYDGLDVFEKRAPFDRTRQVGNGDHLDRASKNIRRLPHRGAHRVAGVGEVGDQRAADKS